MLYHCDIATDAVASALRRPGPSTGLRHYTSILNVSSRRRRIFYLAAATASIVGFSVGGRVVVVVVMMVVLAWLQTQDRTDGRTDAQRQRYCEKAAMISDAPGHPMTICAAAAAAVKWRIFYLGGCDYDCRRASLSD